MVIHRHGDNPLCWLHSCILTKFWFDQSFHKCTTFFQESYPSSTSFNKTLSRFKQGCQPNTYSSISLSGNTSLIYATKCITLESRTALCIAEGIPIFSLKSAERSIQHLLIAMFPLNRLYG